MYGFEIFDDEFVKPLFVSLDLLKRSNIMFNGSEVSRLKKYWRFIYKVPMMILHFVSSTAYIVKLFTEGLDPFEKADMLPLWMATVQSLISTIILMKNQAKIRDAIINMGVSWRIVGLNEKQMNIKDNALKLLHYGGIGVNRVGLAVSWQYLLVPLCETLVRRLVLKQEVELQLPFACVYPFQTDTWPVYLAVYAFQVYCVLNVIYVYQGVNWLLVVLTTYLHLQFLLLQEDLIHVKPAVGNITLIDDNASVYREDQKRIRINDFVRRHQATIQMAVKVDASCNKLTFNIMLIASLIICFFAVAGRASTGAAHALNNYVAIVLILMSILIICYCSQLLSSSSLGIASAAANNLWYKGNLPYQTNIRLIIMRSQKPCCLTLLGCSPIDLDTFNKVVKTTWSYFSLANHIYDKRD